MEIELDLILNTSVEQFKSFCERQNGIKSISLYRDNQIDRIFGNEITEKIDYIFKNNVRVIYGTFQSNPEDFDIHLQKVAFTVRRISIDESPKVRINVLNTQFGKEVKELIEDGIPMKIVPVIDNTGHIHKLNITWK